MNWSLVGGVARGVSTVSLAVVLLASALPAAILLIPQPAHGVAGFGDVASDSRFSEAVQWMVDNGITTGTSAACFSPDGTVTRGQTATFLWRMEGEPDAPRHQFVDVTAPYQQKAVSWMAHRGYTRGTAPTTYSPASAATRGEFAAMLHRLAGRPAAERHSFVDVAAPWQQQPVSWVVAESITSGATPTTFAPNDSLTRGELATILYRYQGSPPVELDPAGPGCAAPSLTLGFGGDLQLLDYQMPWGMLVAITDVLSAPDVMFANLETVVGTRSEVGPPPINKAFNFLSPPEAIDQIVASGIDALGMANNHTWDYGPRGGCFHAPSRRRLGPRGYRCRRHATGGLRAGVHRGRRADGRDGLADHASLRLVQHAGCSTNRRGLGMRPFRVPSSGFHRCRGCRLGPHSCNASLGMGVDRLPQRPTA